MPPPVSVSGYIPPANGGIFATQSYALTMFISFVAGFFLSLAITRTSPRLANTITTAALRGAGLGEPTKMALVVRRDLKMGSGKVAAQCAHAAVGVLDEIYEEKQREERKKAATAAASGSAAAAAAAAATGDSQQQGNNKSIADEWQEWLQAWRSSGSAKVVLQVETEEDLMAIIDAAQKARLPTTYIRDAGRTQIAAGSKTVAAVGPAPVSRVDQVTGKLRLL